MDIDLGLIVQTFAAEAGEQLTLMEESVLALEGRPDDPELLATVFRVVHTLKGNAASLGFRSVADFAHALEDLLDRLREGTAVLSPGLAVFLLQSVDTLRRMVEEAVAGEDGGPAWGTGAAGRQEARPDARWNRTLRVDLGKLDRLLDLTGEIAVARARLASALARSGSPAGDVVDANEGLDPLFVQLQDLVTRLRMVPVGPLFRSQARTVHDLAAAEGREVRLELEGEEVEVDAAVIEQLRDPLLHLVRNAVGHGLEPPDERLARGKEPYGRITLSARYQNGGVAIRVEDDGAGLDRERIAARARELGLAGDPGSLSDADLFRLVLEPGFSTAGTVTDVAGRGVGLDVVRRNVEALRGWVSLDGRPGLGTRVSIHLPLTLALIDGLLVRSAGEVFLVPLDKVVECLDLPLDGSHAGRSSGVLELRGAPLPYLRLREVFGLAPLPDGAPAGRENVVVVEAEEGLAGLAVDALLGKSQTVIKPLGRLFQRIRGVSGSALLGDGRVALILDVPVLLRDAVRREASPRAGEPIAMNS